MATPRKINEPRIRRLLMQHAVEYLTAVPPQERSADMIATIGRLAGVPSLGASNGADESQPVTATGAAQ